MRPILTYYGGKQYIASKIIAIFPKHKTYLEPFCGGGAIFFAKNKSLLETLNDYDDRIINIYRVVRDSNKVKKLIYRLKYTLFSRSEHKLAYEKIKTNNYDDDIDKAWCVITNIMQGFNCSINSGWGFETLRHTYQTKSKHRGLSIQRYIKNLEQIHLRLLQAQIECIDALECIKKYDGEDCLHFIDPPYPEAHQGHYGGYTYNDLQNLIDLLDNIKGKFVLTNYNQPKCKFPDSWNLYKIPTICHSLKIDHLNINKKKETKEEFIWYNYRIPPSTINFKQKNIFNLSQLDN